ncbi:MAG TPA: hypothetical protein VL947_13030 [Cytophagales bacterium]|nr:hypothetical protein [Cytophagales bacterium]
MKNNIVIYLTFLLFSILFSSCTKKDKEVVYPVTGTQNNRPPVGTGAVTIDANTAATSSFSISGSQLVFVSGDKTVKLTFNNATFADGAYTTSAAVAADNEVKIEVQDAVTGEVYILEEDVTVTIATVAYSATENITTLVLSGGAALATQDPTRTPISVGFTIVIK